VAVKVDHERGMLTDGGLSVSGSQQIATNFRRYNTW
jgi:hypothetical protein